MKFLQLPKYLILSFLQEWIPLSFFGLLNSAFCNKERAKLIELLNVKCFSIKDYQVCLNKDDKVRSFIFRVNVFSEFSELHWSKTIVSFKDPNLLLHVWKYLCSKFSTCSRSENNIHSELAFWDQSISILSLQHMVVTASISAGKLCHFVNAIPNKYCSAFRHVDGHTKGTNLSIMEHLIYGEFSNGQFNGVGVMKAMHQDHLYVGQFVNNEMSGAGTEIIALEDKQFTEAFRDAARVRVDTLLKSSPKNKGEYKGDWRQNYPHDKHVYSGQWKGGLYSGQGVKSYANGTTYIGQWSKGKRHGRGTATFPNGCAYHGMWKKHFAHGVGSFTFANGDVLSGVWRLNRIEMEPFYNVKKFGNASLKCHVSGEVLTTRWRNHSISNPHQASFATAPQNDSLILSDLANYSGEPCSEKHILMRNKWRFGLTKHDAAIREYFDANYIVIHSQL